MPATIEVNECEGKEIEYKDLPILAKRNVDGIIVYLSRFEEDHNNKFIMTKINQKDIGYGGSFIIPNKGKEGLCNFSPFKGSVNIKNN